MAKSRKPRKETSWEALRRAAVDEAARLVLLDPDSSDELVRQASAHLASQDGLTLASKVIPGLTPDALRLIKQAMGGVVQPPPTVTTEPELAVESPPTAFKLVPSDQVGDLDTGTPAQAKQASEPVEESPGESMWGPSVKSAEMPRGGGDEGVHVVDGKKYPKW